MPNSLAAHTAAPRRGAAVPDDINTIWCRKDRDPTKVFVDYNQNARDHAIAGAYSVRRNREGTVSTLITWEEIDDVDPRELTIATRPLVTPGSATSTPGSTAVYDIAPLLELADRDAVEEPPAEDRARAAGGLRAHRRRAAAARR